MVVPAEDVTDNNFDMGQLLAVIKQMKQEVKQQMAEQNSNMAEQVKQQMAEQNSNMAEQQIADQNTQQKQNSTELKQALADQRTKQEEVK